MCALFCGKQREATAPIQSLVKLQPWFLSLRWKTCLRQNCSLGSCACSEGSDLGHNALMMVFLYNVPSQNNIKIHIRKFSFMLLLVYNTLATSKAKFKMESYMSGDGYHVSRNMSTSIKEIFSKCEFLRDFEQEH